MYIRTLCSSCERLVASLQMPSRKSWSVRRTTEAQNWLHANGLNCCAHSVKFLVPIAIRAHLGVFEALSMIQVSGASLIYGQTPHLLSQQIWHAEQCRPELGARMLQPEQPEDDLHRHKAGSPLCLPQLRVSQLAREHPQEMNMENTWRASPLNSSKVYSKASSALRGCELLHLRWLDLNPDQQLCRPIACAQGKKGRASTAWFL